MGVLKRLIRYHYQGQEGQAYLREDNSLEVVAGARAQTLEEVTLLAPVQPSKIIGIGLNYHCHAREMNKAIPKEPLMFFKPSTSVIGPGQAIVRPDGYERVDYEGELAIVFSQKARNIPANKAHEVIEGYCCLNDVTVRDLQKRDVQYTRAKGFDTFAPLGPWISTLSSADDLHLITRLNGVVRQDARTSDMIFSIPELVAAVTRVMTMLPGDIISTGTPSGVGPIEPGDVIEVEIDGLGVLRNSVITEKEIGA